MFAIVNLYSENKGELNNFLSRFYNTNLDIYNTNLDIVDDLKWEKKYANPIELAEIIGVFIDNFDEFNIKMWISLDKDVFININENNGDSIIRYLYERFPY